MSPDERAEAAGHPSGSTSGAAESQLPLPEYTHLRRLTNDTGLWEHARILTPRVEHGFCTDDNARGLLVVSRPTSPPSELADLAAIYLAFRARCPHRLWPVSQSSRRRRRLDRRRRQRRQPRSSVVGTRDRRQLGSDAMDAAGGLRRLRLMRLVRIPAPALKRLRGPRCRRDARRSIRATPPPPNSSSEPPGLIAAAASDRIPWPEARLTYDNARLPEALLAAGAARGDRHLISVGIRLLEWLVRAETNHDHFSFTPAGGWAPGDPRPAFDQQPIEAAAMAEACYRAWTITDEPVWRERALDAARWFMGRNDTGMVLYDSETGGTCDGLMERSVNENRGAESTLAGIAALQIAALCSTADLRDGSLSDVLHPGNPSACPTRCRTPNGSSPSPSSRSTTCRPEEQRSCRHS